MLSPRLKSLKPHRLRHLGKSGGSGGEGAGHQRRPAFDDQSKATKQRL